jgi:transposase
MDWIAVRTKRIVYWRFHKKNIVGDEIISFLKYLSRHIPGNLMVIWDGCPTHRSRKVKDFLSSHPRIRTERFPGYAPELNPDEFVWTHLKRDTSNATPDNLSTLGRLLVKSLYRVKRSQTLLRSCVKASSLPWRKK